MKHATKRIKHHRNAHIVPVDPVSFKRDEEKQTIVYEFARGEGILMHVHRWDHEARVEAGSFEVFEGNDVRIVTAPAVLVMKAGIEHGFLALEGSRLMNVTDMRQVGFQRYLEEERQTYRGIDGKSG